MVPLWEASDKQLYRAQVLRAKLAKNLNRYLTEFPAVTRHPHEAKVKAKEVDWEKLYQELQVDESITPVDSFTPGKSEIILSRERFIMYFLLFRLQCRDKGYRRLCPELYRVVRCPQKRSHGEGNCDQRLALGALRTDIGPALDLACEALWTQRGRSCCSSRGCTHRQ